MEELGLPLFSIQDSVTQLKPLTKVGLINESHSYTQNPQTVIENALNTIFPQQSEENKISRTRRMLGETAQTLTDGQIETIVIEFQFLIDSWLDEFERHVFNGMTLKEVLNEG